MVLPLITQMIPSADVLAMASTEVDISKIAPGQAIKTSWRKQPVFVRNLTPQEIAEANAVPLSELRDPQTLAERTKPGKENWLITLGVCTHLGCVPLGVGEGENRGAVRRLFLPVPRLGLRHRGAHPQRPGADSTWWCRNMNSRPTRSFGSAEGDQPDELFLGQALRTQDRPSCAGSTSGCRCRAWSMARSAAAIRCRATSIIAGTSASSPGSS